LRRARHPGLDPGSMFARGAALKLSCRARPGIHD
jgi:hypothetical protein